MVGSWVPFECCNPARGRESRPLSCGCPESSDLGEIASRSPPSVGSGRVPLHPLGSKWLPRKDSNLNKENQNLLCYRYTTRHFLGKVGGKLFAFALRAREMRHWTRNRIFAAQAGATGSGAFAASSLTTTLSMRWRSMSMTSNVWPRYSNTSPSAGTCPRRWRTKPARVR